MTRAKLGTLAIASVIGAVSACGMGQEADFNSAVRGPNDDPDSGKAPSADDGLDAAIATGVVVVHGASFPSFRLCFENLPDMLPQPDSKIMPQSNVVGVEMGSVVRIDPLVAPGRVFVIDRSQIRDSDNGEPSTVKCGELVAEALTGKGSSRSLQINAAYHEATALDSPLGQDGVHILAITGCGSQLLLDRVHATNETCGADWNVTKGNLKANVVRLPATPRDPIGSNAPTRGLPVQLFHLAPGVDGQSASDAGAVAVSFGDLVDDAGVDDAGTGAAPIPVGPLFEGGAPTTIDFDHDDVTVYATHGFRIQLPSVSAPLVIEQSLAEVQELSAPSTVPTEYYRAGSNYALLLVGDPTHEPTFPDGGTNPSYNRRQAIHLLAIPVIDPDQADAGASEPSTSDPPPSGSNDSGS